MAKSGSGSRPLAITCETLGWTKIPKRSESGTYTLRMSGEQVIAFKSPFSDSEHFVAEYRKKSVTLYDPDFKIGGSGLIVYRVNSLYAEQGNGGRDDYVYVFRPGEKGLGNAFAGDNEGNLTNAQITLSSYEDAFGETITPRSSIGSFDFTADITEDALCYSDERNSGIVIEVAAETSDSIIFTISCPDYTQADLWSTLTNADGATLPVDVGSMQTVVDGHDNAAFSLPSSYCIMRYDGSKWHDMGIAARNACTGTMAVRKGVLYFLSGEANDVVKLRQFKNDAWKNIA